MNLPTIIALIAVAAAVFLAIRYMHRQKKKGVACIGCPAAGSCRKHICDHDPGR